MHLVFLNQYYPPDAAPTGVMLEAVAERLVSDGHTVTVLCAAGGYTGGEKRETETGGDSSRTQGASHRVLRIGATRFGRGTIAGKLLDYASYYAGAVWKLLTMHPRPERVVALTTPPYLSVLARVASKFRGADHGHWVMDLYPDVMAAHGMLAERGLAYRGLSWLARFGLGGGRRAALLTLGPDMAQRVTKLLGEEKSGAPVRWVPLWGGDGDGGSAADASRGLRRERGWADDELVVMYSGNMGLGHRFGEILEVAARMANVEHRSEKSESLAGPHFTAVRFVFYGGGKRREEIRDFIREHPGARVELHDYVPAEILGSHLRSADVHLASLDAGWTGTMVPSKLQGVFEVARPVVFIGSGGSSIGRWVRESGGGWAVEPGDVAALAAAIEEAGNPELRARRGDAAKHFADRHFGRQANAARVAGLLGGDPRDRRDRL